MGSGGLQRPFPARNRIAGRGTLENLFPAQRQLWLVQHLKIGSQKETELMLRVTLQDLFPA